MCVCVSVHVRVHVYAHVVFRMVLFHVVVVLMCACSIPCVHVPVDVVDVFEGCILAVGGVPGRCSA